MKTFQRFAATATVAGAVSCTPPLLWYGHDPARAQRFELRGRDGHVWLETSPRVSPTDTTPTGGTVTGSRSAAYDEIAIADLVFAEPRHRFAVPARRGEQWTMLVDGRATGYFDGVDTAAFSDDGDHVAFAATRAGHTLVVHDGRVGEPLDDVALASLAFSRHGARLGYAARKGRCTRVYTSDTPARGCYRSIKTLFVGSAAPRDAVLSADDDGTPFFEQPLGGGRAPLPGLTALAVAPSGQHWAATLKEESGVRVVRDGATAAVVEDARELAFSPSDELSFVAKSGAGWHFVLETLRERDYPWIQGVTFSARGARHAYRAGAGKDVAVVVDGHELARAAFADGVVFSPDERHVAFALREDVETAWLVCDDQRFAFDILWEASIGFSRDGRHFGAVVGDRSKRRLAISLDGRRELPFDSAELFGAAAEGAAHLDGLRGWVAAELDRQTQGGSP